MTNEKINNQIKKLLQLQFLNNAKTKDGIQIEIGKTYYLLENLSEGFKQITLSKETEFQEIGLREHSIIDKWGYSFYSNYDRLFSSKKAAYDYMKVFLNNRITSSKHNIKLAKQSLELLEKLKI